MDMTHGHLAILGGGSWGTALAVHLASHNQIVKLWEYDCDQVKLLKQDRCNQRYLPGIYFPDKLSIEEKISDAVKEVADIIIVVPSHAFRETLTQLKPHLNLTTRIAWATKGLDLSSGDLLSKTVLEVLGERKMAVFSGPSFAREVAFGMPTAIVVASNDTAFAKDIVSRFNYGNFRVYTSSDLIGVQLGGAVKNIIAIAAGICDGLGFGANARSGLITRGLAEIMRLGIALGAKRETFMGLSGLGDLVLTCTDDQSRNRRFGLALGRGAQARDALHAIGQVVEGVYTVNQVHILSERYKIEMPISYQVWRILQGTTTPKQAVIELFARVPKPEDG